MDLTQLSNLVEEKLATFAPLVSTLKRLVDTAQEARKKFLRPQARTDEGFYQEFLLLTALAWKDRKDTNPAVRGVYQGMYADGASQEDFQKNAREALSLAGFSQGFIQDSVDWGAFNPDTIKALRVLSDRKLILNYEGGACEAGIQNLVKASIALER
jgi:hypothetical protein